MKKRGDDTAKFALLGILIVAAVAIIVGKINQTTINDTGVLEGKILIGPFCPVGFANGSDACDTPIQTISKNMKIGKWSSMKNSQKQKLEGLISILTLTLVTRHTTFH